MTAHKLACAAGAALFLCSLSASASPDPSVSALESASTSQVTFIGQRGGLRLAVSYSQEANNILAFVCGDADSVGDETVWFRGAPVPSGRWWYVQRGDSSLWMTANNGELIAVLVRPAGEGRSEQLWFRTVRAEGGEGLYRAKTDHGVIGAIVSDFDGDGTLELQGAYLLEDVQSFIQVVPVVSPVELVAGVLIVEDVDGEPVEVSRADPSL